MLRLQLVAEGIVVSETGEIGPSPEPAEMGATAAVDEETEASPVAQASIATDATPTEETAAEQPAAIESTHAMPDVAAPDAEIRKAS